MRGALWDTFKWQYILSSIYCYFGEAFGIGYTTMLIYLIGYLKEPGRDIKYEITLAGLFGIFMLGQVMFRNAWMIYGGIVAIRIRKCMVGSMYNKVTKLSIKSLTETNSGKLITMVGGDL